MSADHNTLEQARKAFQEEGLPFPPLPAAFEARLKADSEYLFASCEVPYSAFDMASWAYAVDAETPPYALLGFDGRGINSWAVHYFLVEGPLALFVQVPWGGVYTDKDLQLPQVASAFDSARILQAKILEAQHRNLLPAGHRLVVMDSPLNEPLCYWVQGKQDKVERSLNQVDNQSLALPTAIALLDELLSRGAGTT